MRELFRVEPRTLDARMVFAADAGDVLLDVHQAAGPRHVDLRNQDVRLVPEVARKALDVACLERKIELAHQRAAKLFDHAGRLVTARLGDFAFDDSREVRKQAHVGLDLGFDARTANLQHDLAAVEQPCPMHLGDRCGTGRFAFKVDEYLGGRPAERSFDDRQDLLERHGRDAGVQARQFFGPLGRQQILARRQHLAELDEGGAELLEGQSQAVLRLEPGAAGRLAPMQHGACALEEGDDSDPAHEVAEPVPNEHQGDLVQARQISHHAQRRLTHGWTYFAFLDSACWRNASAKPASSPLVSSVMFAPYSRTVSKPGTVRAR